MFRLLPIRRLALFLLAALLAAPSMTLRAQESTSWEAWYFDNGNSLRRREDSPW